jgi:hypothetical protein
MLVEDLKLTCAKTLIYQRKLRDKVNAFIEVPSALALKFTRPYGRQPNAMQTNSNKVLKADVCFREANVADPTARTC